MTLVIRVSVAAFVLACVGSCGSSQAGTPGVEDGRDGSEHRGDVVLRLATFNIENFGPKKSGDAEMLNELAAIIRRYDLVAVQEISDRFERAPQLLLDAVNSTQEVRFKLALSLRTGQQPDDHNFQEQYAYYYRSDRLRVVGDERMIFDDSAHDYFQREPHVARFDVDGGCASFTLINIHTQPDAAVSEIAAVEHVFEWAVGAYGAREHVIALGDFNAGCGYASEEDLNALPLHGQNYDWVVPHSAITNVAGTCPYDRIVMRSPEGNRIVSDWNVDHAFTVSPLSPASRRGA